MGAARQQAAIRMPRGPREAQRSAAAASADKLLASGQITPEQHAVLIESDARHRFETRINVDSLDTVDRDRAAVAPPSPAASVALKKAYRLYITSAIGLHEYEEIARGDALWRCEQERDRLDAEAPQAEDDQRCAFFADGCVFGRGRERRGGDGCVFGRGRERRGTWAPEPILAAVDAPVDAAEWDLERTLCHPETSRLLEDFVEREHAKELLDFVRALAELRRCCDESERVPHESAKRFFDEFLDPESDRSVNVSSRRVAAARAALRDATPVSLVDLEGASDDIKREVLFDIFSRFQRSDAWREWATPRRDRRGSWS